MSPARWGNWITQWYNGKATTARLRVSGDTRVVFLASSAVCCLAACKVGFRAILAGSTQANIDQSA